MRQSVRRWLLGMGGAAAVGATLLGQSGIAAASPAAGLGGGPSAATAGTFGGGSPGYVPPKRELRLGDHGAAVRSVQRRLRALHYYVGKIDGTVGENTLEAVWAFKRVQGIALGASNADDISRATERALVHPKLPRVLAPHAGRERIEVNQRTQVLVLYKRGKIALISHVSTGGGYSFCDPPPNSSDCGVAITPDGNFRAHWFASGWLTVPLGAMYNPVFFIGGAYAIHGDIPVPWYPASHGCVRIPMFIAHFFHKLIHISQTKGTPIIIRGKAPYFLV